MKRLSIILLLALCCLPAMAQQCYWVFFTDKNGTSFNPYEYFDSHAIERYRQCGADLYDVTNYPVSAAYVRQVNDLAFEEVGQSRWFNAVAVMATSDQITAIEQLPFVAHTTCIGSGMQLAQHNTSAQQSNSPSTNSGLTDQLIRMQGNQFVNRGFDGRGIRIAVLDGGFPRVNTHKAFQHLRDNNRILDTWNFPNKKTDVYGWNSHGLMTLSCITGIVDGKQLGLATGSEFLLYRTEVESEPFKEEVWWQMAMERADQHGANIISSSLGYGKERYYTKDMDGTSYVARAANLAARKGILVVNSAGNEADSKQWKTIITPADADSVLCVGGTTQSLRYYDHINFSSYGPSADGRLKPNVVAFGHAQAASNKNDNDIQWVDGTSFSCPLTAGFAACAWQASPDKTNMEMFRLIEQSGDLYPYYDYAMGYGVPQASFFLDKPTHQPTFRFVESADSVAIQVLCPDSALFEIFYNKQRPDGTLVEYANVEVRMGATDQLRFHKGALDSCTLNVWIGGYTDAYRLNQDDRFRMQWEPRPFAPESYSPDSAFNSRYEYDRTADDLKPSLWGNNARLSADFFVQFGNMIRTSSQERQINAYSPASHVGGRLLLALGKAYRLGLGLDYAETSYRLSSPASYNLDNLFIITTDGIKSRTLRQNEFSLELFQRVRLTPGGLFGKGIHWDLGCYVSHSSYSYQVKYSQFNHASSAEMNYKNPKYVDNYRVNFGLTTRLAYDWIGIYARYRLTGITTNYDLDTSSPTSFLLHLPRLEAGIEITL